MRKNAGGHLRRGRAHRVSRQKGERLAPLAGRLRRMLERRIAQVTGRGGRDLSDKDLSAAVVDISRLVTAAARLKKLDEPDAEAGGKDLDSMQEHILNIMYPEEMAAHRRGQGATVAREGGLG